MTINDGAFGFLHIPKTAGTTVNSLFQGLFGSSACKFWRMDTYPHHDEPDFSVVRFLSGHVLYQDLAEYVSSDRCLVGLRNPRARVRSLWNHYRRVEENGISRAAGLGFRDFQAFLSQRAQIPKDDWFGRPSSLFSVFNVENAMCYQIGAPEGVFADSWPSAAECFEIAASRVQDGLFVLLQEHLQECLDVFCWSHSLPRLELPSRRNVHPLSAAPDDGCHQNLSGFDEFDEQLWQLAAAVHRKRYNLMVRQLLDEKARSGIISQGLVLKPHDAWLSRGFQVPEGPIDSGWRWTGPGLESDFLVPVSLIQDGFLTVKTWVLRIMIVNEIAPLTIWNTELLVNGVRIQSEKSDRGDGSIEIKASLENRFFYGSRPDGLVRFTIRTPWVKKLPVSVSHPGDVVEVGIAVSGIELQRDNN